MILKNSVQIKTLSALTNKQRWPSKKHKIKTLRIWSYQVFDLMRPKFKKCCRSAMGRSVWIKTIRQEVVCYHDRDVLRNLIIITLYYMYVFVIYDYKNISGQIIQSSVTITNGVSVVA